MAHTKYNCTEAQRGHVILPRPGDLSPRRPGDLSPRRSGDVSPRRQDKSPRRQYEAAAATLYQIAAASSITILPWRRVGNIINLTKSPPRRHRQLAAAAASSAHSGDMATRRGDIKNGPWHVPSGIIVNRTYTLKGTSNYTITFCASSITTQWPTDIPHYL